MIVFDTSAAVDFLRGGAETKSLVESIEQSGDAVAVTTVSLFELLAPIQHRRLLKEEKAVRAFIRRTVLLGLDANSATEAAKIMGGLLRLGIPINPLDTLISGITVANGAEKIVTSDHDFEQVAKVADLKIQII
jgi:predicted nucleic acid-binding protein